jgi:hypothetical protein
MKARKIKVMISSRCSDLIRIGKNEISFTDLRDFTLAELEKETFLGHDIFDVVISEKIIEPADDTSWNKCLKEIKESDIVLVMFSGHEGYKAKGKTIGICYAEFIEALHNNPSKVFLLDFRKLDLLYSDKTEIKKDVKEKSDFALNVEKRDMWLQKIEIDNVATIEDLRKETLKKSKGIIRTGITGFVLSGSATLRQANHQFGEGLQWTKLNYRFRQEVIKHYVQKAVNNFLAQSDFKSISNSCIIHALPDAMSIAEARELVGRPYLKDLEHLSSIKSGPIHIIGVYKNVTESQLRDVIGHQDVAIIQENFGFYVWDLVNHIQLVYLTNCKDPEVTLLKTQEYFTWLRIHDETKQVIDRANRRFKILKVIEIQKVELKGSLK